jgi:periplasmic divalent cation tolerance protein
MSEVALVYVTFRDAAEAERVAETLLAERLAVCVNILPACTSLYRWQGEIARGTETPALIKTAPILARRLTERLAALHSYELPVIERWMGEASPAVRNWIAAETSQSGI